MEAQGDKLKENCPPLKKARLSLSLKKKKRNESRPVPMSERFANPVTGTDLEMAEKGVVPQNTSKNNEWALRNFTEWMISRSAKSPDDPVPKDLLSTSDDRLLCKWLSCFVMETRQSSGKSYPLKSLYYLLCGLLRVAREKGSTLNFLNKSDLRFKNLHLTLDSVCSKLHATGVGAVKKSAEVISFDDEEMLWQKGILGFDNPSALFNTVFFYVGLHFCLRGGQEHRDLSINQLQRCPEDISIYNENSYYEYSEFISKNNQHRFKDIHAKNKVVKTYANTNSPKCIVKILDTYLGRLPSNPKAFYLRPSTHNQTEHPTKAWFINVPVGVNTLNTVVATMSEKADLLVRFTNHSLRATSASRMYALNVPEKLIAEKTGHRSLAGLRAYERTTTVQEQALSKTLTDPSFSFIEAAEKCSSNQSEELCDSKDEVKAVATSEKSEKLPMIKGTLNNCVFNFY